MKFEFIPVIGLEVHIELNTLSKMFCRCVADHFGKQANISTCPVCLGLPGAMPYPNIKAIKDTILFGLSLGCTINKNTKFDRKHYFYPDLPKGYQISQYDLPFCINGMWRSKNNSTFRIRRIHLEEDTGKLLHQEIEGKMFTLIDFNRSGVPLMELVTEPDFFNSDIIVEFLKEIQLLARYLNISNADMEKGSMRLEANISLRKVSDSNNIKNLSNIRLNEKELPTYKVELKNINSFKFLKNAIDAEISRQKEILKSGKTVFQETRGYNEKTNSTFLQRSKEEAKDYRYFPEPDIPEITINDKFLNDIKNYLVETPWDKRKRFISNYALNQSYAEILIADKKRADYFEKLYLLSKKHNIGIKTIADFMINKNMDKIYDEPELLILEILKLTKKAYKSEDDTLSAVREVLQENIKAVNDYKNGKGEVIGFLIGQVQKKLKGEGDAKIVKDKILESIYK